MNKPQSNSPRDRLKQLLAIPERQRTEEEWDELNELEIMFAAGNRDTGQGYRDAGHDGRGNRDPGHGQRGGGGGNPQQQGQGQRKPDGGGPGGGARKGQRKFHKKPKKPNNPPR
jgi:hypothetical protein